MIDAWLWLLGGCALYLLVRLNLWYYSLPKDERDENEADLWIW